MRTDSSFGQRFFWLNCLAFVGGASAVVVCGEGAELRAQQVQLRPQAGLYLPTRISFQNGMLHVQQKIGVSVGARLTLTFNDRFDVVTGVTYIPGYAMFRGAGRRIELATGSHLLTASTGARYWLLPAGRRISWEIHTGLGAAFGGQPAYVDLFESSTVSAILGSTVRYQIGRIVSFQLGIQDRVYRVRFGGQDPGRARKPLQLSFGVGLPFLEFARSPSSDRQLGTLNSDAIAAAPTR